MVGGPVTAQGADLFIQDTPLDAGLEPNPDPGPMWVSEDIWVRTAPDPGYRPYPFNPASPPWTPLPHENPEYRDPIFSSPNYVYVRVRNRGSSASTGTERLTLHFAKASSGLAWPTTFVDSITNQCGTPTLSGAEVTKPRRNAATVSQAERDRYRNAVIAVATNTALVYPDGMSYWRKQQHMHRQIGASYPYAHNTAAFLPWHREMMNRYEAALQAADPLVKLLYWDWTTDPRASTGGTNLFPNFMGTTGHDIGAPLSPSVQASETGHVNANNQPSSSIPRYTSTGARPTEADGVVVGTSAAPAGTPSRALYPGFSTGIEGGTSRLGGRNHNGGHGYIGGAISAPAIPPDGIFPGDMSTTTFAARDPFFFLHHTNIDRLWAQWQRNVANVSRLDGQVAYGTDVGSTGVSSVMGPWDGTGSVRPWTAGDGHRINRSGQHANVITPPIYDTAPLVVPVLQPGQAVVLQIPWYPPDPGRFACLGGDQGHFCLVARIETQTNSPFGMTTPEGIDINANTRNNNNIGWKNITVVDAFAGATALASILIQNPLPRPITSDVRFREIPIFGLPFLQQGTIRIDLGRDLAARWERAGGAGEGIERVGDTTIQVFSEEAAITGIRLRPGESFNVNIEFELGRDYVPVEGVFPTWDLIQTANRRVLGGQRFHIDLSKLAVVPRGSDWRYRADAGVDREWFDPRYDDNEWQVGPAVLGFGDDVTTIVGEGVPEKRPMSAYFRREFEVSSPELLRQLFLDVRADDGGIVYLNGEEVARVNMPEGEVEEATPAERPLDGVERELYIRTEIDPGRLVEGRNVLAVEVHRASPDEGRLGFDLELFANPASNRQAPSVMVAEPRAGTAYQVGDTIDVEVEAIDPDGKIASVSLFADEELVETVRSAPYRFRLEASEAGVRALRAVAVADDGAVTENEVRVTVLDDLPPEVRITSPTDGSELRAGEEFVVSAEATDREVVTSVEFIAKDHAFFDSPELLVGTAREAPFTASLSGLEPGHYNLIARATDAAGQVTESAPIQLMVH